MVSQDDIHAYIPLKYLLLWRWRHGHVRKSVLGSAMLQHQESTPCSQQVCDNHHYDSNFRVHDTITEYYYHFAVTASGSHDVR